MPISGQGWELHVMRMGVQHKGSATRTYGAYQAYQDGRPIPGLSGAMCETAGPGDNTTENNGRRVEAARYPLWTQFGRYRTNGYSTDLQTAGAPPMPALLLLGTGNRRGILIHPAHPPKLFLSSVGCFNPTNPITASEDINFWDSRARVVALIDDLRVRSPQAFASDVTTRIPSAFVVVDGEPMGPVPAWQFGDTRMEGAAAAVPSVAEPASLPISKGSALMAARWLMDNFGDAILRATAGKAYEPKHLCAIVCQETAYKWLKWIGQHDTATIVARCVFDASGDYPGTSRSAFPRNTAAFRDRYGNEFTAMLIEEANLSRRLQGWDDRDWVYKGYGIFQYDLQHVVHDEAFFRDRGWYDFDACLTRCCRELDAKLASSNGDLWTAIRKYNGSGQKAVEYMENVKVFTKYCSEVTG